MSLDLIICSTNLLFTDKIDFRKLISLKEVTDPLIERVASNLHEKWKTTLYGQRIFKYSVPNDCAQLNVHFVELVIYFFLTKLNCYISMNSVLGDQP